MNYRVQLGMRTVALVYDGPTFVGVLRFRIDNGEAHPGPGGWCSGDFRRHLDSLEDSGPALDHVLALCFAAWEAISIRELARALELAGQNLAMSSSANIAYLGESPKGASR